MNPKPECIPISSFLHRVFPSGAYNGSTERTVRERIYKPRRDSEAFSLGSPVDWEASDRTEDRNWRMQLQGWAMFHPLMSAFDDYDDKSAIVDYFIAIAKDWWDQYGGDPDAVVTSRMPDSYAWYDMSVGFRALVIAFFLDRIRFHSLALDQRNCDFLNTVAEKHIHNLSAPSTLTWNNHGIFQVHGLIALIEMAQSEDLAAERRYAQERMEDLVASQFDEVGVHREHSPHYHFYVLATVESAFLSGWYKDSDLITRRVNAARAMRPWLVDPRQRPFCVGDSILTEQDVEMPDARQSDSRSCLIGPMNRSGYGLVRSDWQVPPESATALFFMGMFNSKTHKHRDCLSIDWFDRGKRLVCDSGKYGYKTDDYRRYVLSARAHNSIEIDGFDVLRSRPYGSAIEDAVEIGSSLFKLSGTIRFPALTHHRTIYLKAGEWLIVRDELDLKRPHKFTQWFHFHNAFSFVPVRSALRKQEGSESEPLSAHLVDQSGTTLFVDNLDHSLRLSFFRGDERPSLQGFISEKDYVIEPSPTLGLSGHSENARVTTVLSLGEHERDSSLRFASELVAR